MAQAFNPQALATTLWALAGLRFHPEATCLRTAASHALQTLDSHTPQVTAQAWDIVALCPQEYASRAHAGVAEPRYLKYRIVYKLRSLPSQSSLDLLKCATSVCMLLPEPVLTTRLGNVCRTCLSQCKTWQNATRPPHAYQCQAVG